MKGGDAMQRFDTTTFQATKTDEGFIADTPIIGRTGLLRYQNADGSERWEYRPPKEAFSAASLASIRGKPITVGHKAMVTAGNVRSVQPVGTVLTEGRQDGDAIRADIVLYNLPTGARELSCGYTLDLDETPGKTADGRHYDAVQRNIRYNHLAIVPKGRAGIARLNMDGEQEAEVNEEGKEGTTMGKIRIDSGLEYEAAPEVGVFVEKLRQDSAEKQKKLDELQAKYDAALSDLAKEKKERADEEKAQLEKFYAAVAERVKMLETAKAHKLDKAEEMTNRQIMEAVIRAARPDVNLDGKSDDYINAAFDMAQAAAREDGMAEQRKAVSAPTGKPQEHEDETDAAALMEKLRKDEAEAYMKEVK